MTFIEGPDATRLAARLDALVGGATVRARPAGGALRRFFRSTTAGIGDVAVLEADLGPERTRLRILVPDRADLLVSGVARVIATVVEVRHLFGRHADHIRELTFDLSDRGLGHGRWAGAADPTMGFIHLNATFVLAERRIPDLTFEAVAAHECWHQIEHAFELRRFTESIEFRRALGQYFGVDTLEHVLTGNEVGASPAQREAFERLRTEVSDYATTRRVEATAEIMEIWWCSPAPQRPIGILFGRLMAQYFDVHRS